MSDKEKIISAYKQMYNGMIEKNREKLDQALDDSFVLIHMTGMRQNKDEFTDAVLDGTLNYYSAQHENLPVTITDENAVLIGQSLVEAAVFGGRRNTWRLQQKCSLKKHGEQWKITRSVASTY